jgi:vesicle-fusing ATPase
LGNILIIGMTNRKDMIDEAVLRPGRLEVHVEVGLPDEEGRKQIFRIHTARIRENERLGPDVDLDDLATRCNNYTGAEIEAVIKSAASFAFHREIDINDLSKELNPNIKILKNDFETALLEVRPMFGTDESSLTNCLRDGFIDYGT